MAAAALGSFHRLASALAALHRYVHPCTWRQCPTHHPTPATRRHRPQVLEDMLGSGVRPNDRTYASLIDACARAGDKPLALRVYRKAQREGCAATLMVYSAAVHACVHAAGGCDSEAAMQIYADLQRWVAGRPPAVCFTVAAAPAAALPCRPPQRELQLRAPRRRGLDPVAPAEPALALILIH